MPKLTVLLNPEQRKRYLDIIMRLDGLSAIQEDAKKAYCPISLTAVSGETKSYLQSRQDILIEILQEAGLDPWDPAKTPFAPDAGRAIPPATVYTHDTSRIAESRFVVGQCITPSYGVGIEFAKAHMYNRISVMIFDNAIGVSRMLPHRTIYLAYDRFDQHREQFVKLFKMLQDYEPGMGFADGKPVLLGFDRSGTAVDLEELVYTKFPELQYHYDGSIPILKLRAENPKMFYEFYPYLPAGRTHKYVGMDNEYMKAAYEYAREHSLDPIMPNGCVFVKNGEIVARGANGSDYHQTHECERVKQGIPTGQGYELCEGCHPKNHGEPKAIAAATAAGIDLSGSDVYLWGHWWCCESCWNAMIDAGINNVYLLKDSEILFNKKHPDNIVGKQFS